MSLFSSKSQSNEPRELQVESPVVPRGSLLELKVSQINPSRNNPRRLFDAEPLKQLRESIKLHGVLVPLTVYKLPGQDKYAIVDGERRFRCCEDLEKEGHSVLVPANVVEAPSKTASLIYMFNIHSFREQWELMPTALGLREVMDSLGVTDTGELSEITGLSTPQVERCKIILSYDKKYQMMSMDPDSKKRIPSNFWVELHPVLQLVEEHNQPLQEQIGTDGIINRLVEKYRNGKIKSVIHFRRVREAYEVSLSNGDVDVVSDRLREFVLDPELETRRAFDGFIIDNRKVQKAVDACDSFIDSISKAKLSYEIDGRDEVIAKMEAVIRYAVSVIDQLKGTDPSESEDDS
ncbi:ParB/RepB/Spo0J family partition protein [Rubrivirga sp.]|uniref:ParB/RepB/Spo0J family partition protein n=1 Tax=Rubrivirga sp. TaxID=1885344 RepID=UPI003B516EDF